MSLLFTCIVACLGALLLLYVKKIELQNSRQTFLGRFLSKGDPMIIALGNRVQDILHRRRERAFFLFLVHIPSQIEAMFGNFRNKSHDYYHGVNAKMRNKRDLAQNTVSPYMRSMTLRRDGDRA